MKQLPPAVRKQIIEAWLTGTVTEHQLAEEFNVSRAIVKDIIGEYQRERHLRPIGHQTLSVARELYNVMPTELAQSFVRRFESVAGASRGLLMTPSL